MSAAQKDCRENAIAAAGALYDSGAFFDLLARRVAIPSTSHEPDMASALDAYLRLELAPYLADLGFDCSIHDNPTGSANPLLVATRIEDPALPTVLSYGHGDTVAGMDDRWTDGTEPWKLIVSDDRWYGRGTADNKAQHTINLAALACALEAGNGALGYNAKILIETGEERGSPGLRASCENQAALLKADLFVASDGPRVSPDQPTIFLGSRGAMNLRLTCRLRDGAHHSGNWGGVLPNAATRLAHALASLTTTSGAIAVDGLRNPPLDPALRRLLEPLALDRSPGDAQVDPDWGEPGYAPPERLFGLNSLEILSIESGGPVDRAANAIPGLAQAVVQLRFTVDTDWQEIAPALEAHLTAQGFGDVSVSPEPMTPMPATRLDPDHPAVTAARASIEQTLGKPVTLLPNLGGTIPNDCFSEVLGLPTLWVPHSYAGCNQHAPDEHVLPELMREGLTMMAGLWCDLRPYFEDAR